MSKSSFFPTFKGFEIKIPSATNLILLTRHTGVCSLPSVFVSLSPVWDKDVLGLMNQHPII